MLRGISSLRADQIATAIKAIALIAVPVALSLVPFSVVEHGPRLCLFHNLTGHDCPGCGMTRSLVALCYGDLASSFAYNRGIIIVGPLLFLLWGKEVANMAKSLFGPH